MAQQVLFIHSAGPQGEGQGSSGLLRYLEKELKSAFQLMAPKMPVPEDPKHPAWKSVLKEEIATLEDGSILVGHSIGGSALLKFLSEENHGKSFAKVISIASPYWGIDESWQLESFMLAEDFAARNSLLPPVALIHSTGDEIVPFTHLEKYQEALPAAIVRKILGNDHIFANGLPELADEIKKG